MLKCLGTLCILCGGVLARQYQVAALRREVDTLPDLLAALNRMAEEIRMTRTPLPRLLDGLGRGRGEAVSAFFSNGAQAVRQGEDAAAVWQANAWVLPVSPEDKRSLAELGTALKGDEESICKAICLTCLDLTHSLEELRRRRPETEKRTTALCLSATALLVILLI